MNYTGFDSFPTHVYTSKSIWIHKIKLYFYAMRYYIFLVPSHSIASLDFRAELSKWKVNEQTHKTSRKYSFYWESSSIRINKFKLLCKRIQRFKSIKVRGKKLRLLHIYLLSLPLANTLQSVDSPIYFIIKRLEKLLHYFFCDVNILNGTHESPSAFFSCLIFFSLFRRVSFASRLRRVLFYLFILRFALCALNKWF